MSSDTTSPTEDPWIKLVHYYHPVKGMEVSQLIFIASGEEGFTTQWERGTLTEASKANLLRNIASIIEREDEKREE